MRIPLALIVAVAIYLMVGKEFAGAYLVLVCIVRTIKYRSNREQEYRRTSGNNPKHNGNKEKVSSQKEERS